MKQILLYLISILFINTVSFSQVNPQIQNIINQVNLDSLSKFVNELSGEVPVIINNQTDTIKSRHKDYPGNDLAADYIEQKLESFGLTVLNQVFSATGRNVYAEQPGTEYPDQRYIICAHYDDYPDGPIAPGADDNASGTAAVLEAARLLSNYSSKYTIVYALWDEEEQGLHGSTNYVYQALNNNEDIQGVINIDMIGWDSDNDMKLWVNTIDTANSVYLSDMTVEVNTLYQIGLDPQVLNPGYGSDNLVFWDHGFSAIGVEEYYGFDWNDYYHTTEDKIDKFNLTYFHRCAKMVIGTLASIVELNSSSAVDRQNIVVEKFALHQNYPNPFNPVTTISYSLPIKAQVELVIYNTLGESVMQLVNEEKETGKYTVEFNATNLPSGIYFYKLQAGSPSTSSGQSFVETRKMVLLK